MIVKKVITGYLNENCYILENNNKCLVVDPGDDLDLIMEEIGDNKVVGILITHAHFDHIGALEGLYNKTKANIYYRNINNEINYDNLIDVKEKEYDLGDFIFKCIYMPGHRNDLVTFYFEKEKIMFTGDFLFYLSVGRTDLEYGDYEEMNKSIELIKKYDDDIIIYPGHSSETTLGFEKKYNEYLR